MLKPLRISNVVIMTIALLMVGCAPPPPLNTPFNFQETQARMLPGTVTVIGSSFRRSSKGEVKSCAGLPIMLIPVTAYSSELFQ